MNKIFNSPKVHNLWALIGGLKGLAIIILPLLVLDVILFQFSKTSVGGFTWITLHFIATPVIIFIYTWASIHKSVVPQSIVRRLFDIVATFFGVTLVVVIYLNVGMWFSFLQKIYLLIRK